ncbi:hypothetical protein VTN49DRAFT_4903 [Thermomyces lanuginosus]|uniref:uncharacterized protein n=1 Tax=Thermomyces lanuginosus TaxID=5541 RepID=UPI0037448B5E
MTTTNTGCKTASTLTSLSALENGFLPAEPSISSPKMAESPWRSKPLPRIPWESDGPTRESIIDSYMHRGEKDSNSILLQHHKRNDSASITSKQWKHATHPSLQEKRRSSVILRTFLFEEHYGTSTSMNMAHANHYFRHKKWELFPELAPPTVARAPQQPPRRRHKTLVRKRPRGGSQSSSSPPSSPSSLNWEGLRVNLKPVRGYMQAALKRSTFPQLRLVRPWNKSHPNSRHSESSAFDPIHQQRVIAETSDQLRALSPESSIDSLHHSSNGNGKPWRTGKEPATILRWKSARNRDEPSSREYHTRKILRLDPQQSQATRSTSSRGSQSSSSSSPSITDEVPPPQRKTLQQVLAAIDGATQKLVESRAARRREELKKNIRLVGLVKQSCSPEEL